MANKAIKYRLYPNKKQELLFRKTFGCCRKIWNLMLADKIDSYNKTKLFDSPTPASYKKEYPYLSEVDSLALCNVQLHLEQAFTNRFSKNRKSNTGFPKFKSLKRSRKSYTTNNQIKKGKPSIAIIGSYIKLPKLGKVKAVIHRLPKDDWSLKSVTVSMDVDGCFYASVLFVYDEVIPNHIVNNINAVGLDYKSNGLYVDNNGNTVENHHFFKHSYKKLAKEQRRLSRKKGSKKGEEKSHNYKKQQRKVAKIHEKIANQRKYHLHMESNKIVNCYDVVCVESLNMKWLANKKFGNGKVTMDNGYGTFLTLLEYKLHDRGKILVKVDKWYPSSQLCYDCGYKNPLVKDLNVRGWICPHCGSYHDRDINAAKNILREGLRILATDCC